MRPPNTTLPRHLLLLFFASALCAACYGQPPAKPAQTIRVVSWNLDWFPGKKQSATADEQKAHMEQAQQALRELNPDVLLLQEVRDWKSAEELCSVVPNLRVQVISRFQPRPQNQVIATNLPVDSAWSEKWKDGASDPPRGYVFAAIELPQKRFLLTYSLHLKSNSEESAMNPLKRQEAAGQLLVHAQEMQKLYGARGGSGLLMGGDMNTALDEKPRFAKEQTLRALIAAGFHWTFAGVPIASRITIPAKGRFPDNCFDHIFTAGLGQQTASVKTYPGLSDHNPVILDLDLSKADFQPRLDTAAGLALLKPAPASPESKKEFAVTATLNANDHAAIRAAVGKTVAVRGKVHDVGKTKTGSINFVNFEGNQRGQFVGIVKGEDMAAVTEALGGELKARLTGKTVELRGEIVLYKDIPQIVVKGGNEIRVVEDAVGGAVPPAPAAAAPSEGYVASVNSAAFHKAGCKSAATILAKNLVRFKTREEAIQAGKRECKECKP